MSYRSKTTIRAFEQPWGDLPNSIRGMFGPKERDAYTQGAPYFKQLAEQSGVPQLIQLFSEVTDDHPMFVFVECDRDARAFIWFAFTLVYNNISRPLFRLSQSTSIPHSAPEQIKRLYSCWGGIRSDDEIEDGLIPPEKIRCVRLPTSSRSPSSMTSQNCAERIYAFLSYGNGDMAGWAESGECVLKSQCKPYVRRMGLRQCIDAFLDSLCEKQDTNDLFGHLPE